MQTKFHHFSLHFYSSISGHEVMSTTLKTRHMFLRCIFTAFANYCITIFFRVEIKVGIYHFCHN
jgi:hypothetical protein